MIELKKVGPPLTEECIARFERELEAALPEPYRRFLFRSNGGMLTPGMQGVDFAGECSADIHVFFGLSLPVKSYDLRWNKDTLSERIPENRLAIACDSCGGAFCIVLQGADRGAVLYCELQSVAFNYEADPDFYPVAADFDSFLNKLREFHDVADEFKETEYGYTWHRHQDGTTMQLVPRDIYEETAHTSGVSPTRS